MDLDIDVVCRKPDTYGNNYYMMEGVLINKKTAKTILKNRGYIIVIVNYLRY